MNTPQQLSWPEVLEKCAPELFKKFRSMEGLLAVEGSLPLKTKVLMMMLCDAMLAHDGGVAALAGRARSLGASEEEIAETLEVGLLMGGLPALASGSSAFREKV